MKRPLCIFALLTLIVAADWSSAQRRRPRRGGGRGAAVTLQVKPVALEVVPSTNYKAMLRVQNASASTANVRLSVANPPGIQARLEQQQFFLPAFQFADVAVLIQVQDTDQFGPTSIGFRASGGGRTGAVAEMAVVILKPVEILKVAPAFDAGGNPLCALTIRNNLTVPLQVTGELRCTGGPTFAAPTQVPVPLKPGATIPLALEPAGEVDPVRQFAVEAQVKIVGDGTVKSKGHLNFTPCFYLGVPPDIDGDLTDWSDLGTLRVRDQWRLLGGAPWNGEADLSATVRFRWDEQNLYLGVETVDNEHLQRGDQISQQDCLVVNIVGMPAKQSKRKAPAVSGLKRVFLAVAESGPKSEGDGIAGMEFVGKQTETGVSYEVALPFASLGLERVGHDTLLPLALAVHDLDGTGRKALRFFEGPGGNVPESQYGFLALTASTTFEAIEGEVLEEEGEVLEGEAVGDEDAEGEALEDEDATEGEALE